MSSTKKSLKVTALERLLNNRLPLIGRFLRVQAADLLLEDGSSEAAAVLKEASAQNPDPVIRQIVDLNLGKLTRISPAGARASSAPFGRIGNRVLPAPQNPPVRPPVPQIARPRRSRREEVVLHDLKAGNLDALKANGPDWIWPLLAAGSDPDPEIRANLKKVLRDLKEPQAREALYRRLIVDDFPLARAFVIEMGMAPEDLTLRALFFFLTGQGERYEVLDFDRRLLCAAYTAGNADVRRRIRERLRSVGRPELLTVVIGQDSTNRVAEMTADEIEFVVGMLQLSQNWSRLWGLAFETTLLWSARILEILVGADWQPPEAERALFVELRTLLEAGLLLDSESLSRELPRIFLQARLRAPGRINDVAFSPRRPLLGVGTGARKVVLWNYQTAQRECVLEGFERSIGQVVFARDGTLACAERSHQVAAPSGIYSWNGRRLRRLGQHQGQVTALEAVSGSTILSAGRDCDIALWDVASGQQIARHTQQRWPRFVRVTPSAAAIIVLGPHSLQLLNLADMRLVERTSFSSMPTCAALLARQSNLLFVGLRNGVVMARGQNSSEGLFLDHDLCAHADTVRGVEVLPEHGYILTAGREGEVRFFNLITRALLGSAPVSEAGLTTMHVSPDEAFVAIGHADGMFSLWDLRGPDVATLLCTPLASVTPLSLGLLDAFANNLTLKESLRRAITYASLIVRHRIRFDIEVESSAPSIIAGEFDIEVESS